MKLKRVVLVSAVGGVGVVASALFASDRPQPVAATQPTTAPVVGGAGVDVEGVARFVREAADPSATVAAYAAAVGQVGTSVVVEDAYVRRMAEFGLPELAEMQAQDVLRRDPNNDVARAVVAYVLGRRGQAVDALANIAQAAGGDRVVADPFVLRTAGQLVAWYDTQADKTQVPEQVRAELDGMRQKLGTQETYAQAYAAAKEAYEGNPAPTAAPAPVAAAPAPAPVQPQQQPVVEPPPAVTTYEPVATEVPSGPTYYAPTAYEDSYAYSYPMPYAYSGYYYQPIYSHYSYWPGGYRRPYVPPVVIPRDHHHDHGGNDGHGGHGGPGHDGNHGGNGGGGGEGPRVHRFDDVKNNNRLRNDDVVVKRAIELPVASYPAPPVSTARIYQEMEQAKARPQPKEQPKQLQQPKQQREQQQPKQEQPKQQQQQSAKQEQSRQQRQQEQPSQSRQQRSQSDGGGNSSRRVETPAKAERRPDPPAAARPAPSAPPQRSSDRPSQQQQQSPRQSQPSGGDRGDRGDRKSR